MRLANWMHSLSLARSSVLVLVGVRRCLISSAARVDCSLRSCLTADLADNWASMYPKDYSGFCSRMDSISGLEMEWEAENCRSHCFAGLLRPRPPNLVGRAKISLSVSLGGGLPVMVGMNTVRRMFFRS